MQGFASVMDPRTPFPICIEASRPQQPEQNHGMPVSEVVRQITSEVIASSHRHCFLGLFNAINSAHHTRHVPEHFRGRRVAKSRYTLLDTNMMLKYRSFTRTTALTKENEWIISRTANPSWTLTTVTSRTTIPQRLHAFGSNVVEYL